MPLDVAPADSGASFGADVRCARPLRRARTSTRSARDLKHDRVRVSHDAPSTRRSMTPPSGIIGCCSWTPVLMRAQWNGRQGLAPRLQLLDHRDVYLAIARVEDLPPRWPHVRAAVGGGTDEGPGVAGVGGEPAVTDHELAGELVRERQLIRGDAGHHVAGITVAEPGADREPLNCRSAGCAACL
jgi:hypothetical protein